MSLKGYHDPKTLPIKVGQRVRVPKGASVRSTNPSKRTYTTSRAQVVLVRSLGCGQSYTVGHAYPDGTRRGSLFHREDANTLREIYGTGDPNELVNHPDATIQDHTVFLPVQNPAVVWAGSGGYWCEVDIDLVEVVD